MKTLGELRPAVIETISIEMRGPLAEIGLTCFQSVLENLYCQAAFYGDSIGIIFCPDFHDGSCYIQYFLPTAEFHWPPFDDELILGRLVRTTKSLVWRNDLSHVRRNSNPWKLDAVHQWAVGVLPVVIKYLPVAQALIDKGRHAAPPKFNESR